MRDVLSETIEDYVSAVTLLTECYRGEARKELEGESLEDIESLFEETIRTARMKGKDLVHFREFYIFQLPKEELK